MVMVGANVETGKQKNPYVMKGNVNDRLNSTSAS